MPAADRPRRENVNKPKDLYVPDESTFQDDLSVDSDVDVEEDSDFDDVSIVTGSSTDTGPKLPANEEYENDSFVVPDDEDIEMSDASYSGSEESFEEESCSDESSCSMEIDDDKPQIGNIGSVLADVFTRSLIEGVKAPTQAARQKKVEHLSNVVRSAETVFKSMGTVEFHEKCNQFTQEMAIKEDAPSEDGALSIKSQWKLANVALQLANALVTASKTKETDTQESK